ncbi:MAG: phosphate propanoyltransferase [Atribacterota bacterium]|jgi:putative phosphotransacetylase|uniref:Phosphate propanoyltransferase n=1 Tax=Atribacter laminatus TaxID=2847778 RepID=A0A7T1F248_ATRLM|nr:phosphate propanoyltransferase [Atribacter laminatus]MDI9593588.1 phosphate propanoyltransferase [Atribacterota bacterium]QPM67412.1 Phosphate propanoyltransferase [Atribacter laminatus]
MEEKNRDKNQLLTEIITETVYKYLADAGLTSNQDYTIPVEVSNRHVHLTREALDALFGQNYQLTKVRDISQPGEFASDEKVTLVSSKMRMIENVRIVGPVRAYNQAELTVTDGYTLGVSLPTRLSGDVVGSQSITMIGPKGAINLPEGAIRAARHIHMTPEDAEKYQVKDNQRVKVETEGENGVIFKDVIIRVSNKCKLAFHIDIEEANAANVQGTTYCRILFK